MFSARLCNAALVSQTLRPIAALTDRDGFITIHCRNAATVKTADVAVGLRLETRERQNVFKAK